MHRFASPTARPRRGLPESAGPRTEVRERERPRRDERTEFRECSRSRERQDVELEDGHMRTASPGRYPLPSSRHRGNLGQCRALSSGDQGAERRPQPGYTHAPPFAHNQNGGSMPRMAAQYGRVSSAAIVRPDAAPLHPKQLTGYVSNARNLQELLSLHEAYGDRFDNFNIGAFWSRFKNLPHGEPSGLSDRLAPVCERTVQLLPQLSARQVANVSHAFAKSRLHGGAPYEGVWAALPDAVHGRLSDFNPQELSNTTWAFATAGHASPALFEAISAEAVRQGLRGFTEQNLAYTAWAFAIADCAATALFGAIAVEVVHRGLGEFRAQNLSNTAWAFATAGHAATDLFDAISAEALRRWLRGFK